MTLFLSLGCSGKAEKNAMEPAPGNGTPVQMVFSATAASPEVKTTLADDLGIRWQSWDKITVFSGADAAGSEFTVSSLENDNKKANFSGLGLPATDHYAVSPAQSGATITGGVITAVLPMTQGVLEGSFGAQANLSAAVSDASSSEFFFRNVTGILSLTIADSGVTGVRLESLGDEKLSGETRIRFQEGIPVAAPTGAAHNWVSLSGALQPNKEYYFAVFPGSFSQGFRITLYKNGQYASVVKRTPLTLERNGNVLLGNIPALTKWKTPGTVVLRGEAAEDGQVMTFAGNQYADMNISRNRGTQIEAFASDEYNYEVFTRISAGHRLYFQDGDQRYAVFSGIVAPIASASEAPAAPVDHDGVYRVRLNLPYGKAYFQEITAVEYNRVGVESVALSYAGNGTWTCPGLRLKGSDDRYKFHFTIDGQTQVYGRIYNSDQRPGGATPASYWYVQPAAINQWEPAFKFPGDYYTGDTGQYYADLTLSMNADGAHYTHSLSGFVDKDSLPSLGADEGLSIQGTGAPEAGQVFRYSDSFAGGSGYADESSLAGPSGYDYEIFTRLEKSKPFYFTTSGGHKFALNAGGTAIEAIATPSAAAYAGVSQDGVYRIRISSSSLGAQITRTESAEMMQPTYKNQQLQYVGNGVWEGKMLDLYWKPKPEWGANRQWQYKFQIYFNQAGSWQYYGYRTEDTVQPATGFWNDLFSVENDNTWNIYTVEDTYVFDVRLQLNADGYTFGFSNPTAKADAPSYVSLDVTSLEGTFTMHKSSDGSVFEGVSTFSNGTAVSLVATDTYGRQHARSVNSTVDGVALLEVSADLSSASFTALPNLLAEGNAVNGFSASNGVTLSYAGHGVFRGDAVTFAGSSEGNADSMTPTYPYSKWGRARFTFVKPGDSNLEIRRLDGSRKALEWKGRGATSEMQINPGTYNIVADLRNFTLDIQPVHDGSRRITVMGSSVPTGTGATGEKGYMYLFGTNALTPGWTLSNRSVPGNSTVTLAERYDDLVMDGGAYVIYALSLGNEGIHGAANQDAVYKQWKDNMQALISRARAEGRKVVVMGNYGRGDFNASDYSYVKAINLEIAQWNVPSMNVLGAVDDEAGRWPAGYQNGDDAYHPNDEGHAEMSYTLVPSVFDAMEAGKPLPVRDASGSIDLTSGTLGFTPEATVHPFAVAFWVKTAGSGSILHIDGVNRDYDAASLGVNDGSWHLVAVTHYYAQGVTRVYVDGVEHSSATERMVATRFSIGGGLFRELFFWRSAMNAGEISALYGGAMLKSSLEIYAPFKGGAITNLATSTNTLNQ